MNDNFIYSQKLLIAMTPKLETANSIIKNEGLFSLIKKGIIKYVFKSYIFSFLYLPFCFIKVKKSKIKNLNTLVDFVFNSCHSYLAPAQVKSEITSLLYFVKGVKPKTMMEIGTARGGTLFLFSKVVPKDSFIISLDLPGGRFGGGYPRFKIPLYKSFAKNKQIINLIRQDSHNIKTLQKIKDILGDRKIDFLFIDGDHTYEGVKRDFELYSQLVRKGGIIAFHDIAPHPPETKCEVSKFWNEIKKKYEYREFVEDWEQNWAGIGLIKF